MAKVRADMDKSKSVRIFGHDDGRKRRKGIRTAFKATARRANIPGLRPYDLRQIFVRWLRAEAVTQSG